MTATWVRAVGQPTIDLYARISRSTDDTRGRSVEGQVEDGIDDIAARGATLGKVFRDESLSGCSLLQRRAQWSGRMTRTTT